MGLDQLLELLSNVSMKALPIAGLVVLVLLSMFIKHLIQVLKSANEAVRKLEKTLDTANKELVSLEKPLQTLSELSETVDYAHEASKQAVKSSVAIFISNFSSIKDWVMQQLNKEKQNEETHQEDSQNGDK